MICDPSMKRPPSAGGRHTVSIVGCDASTVFDIELTPDESALVHRLAAASRETSEYDCEPTIRVVPAVGASSSKRDGQNGMSDG